MKVKRKAFGHQQIQSGYSVLFLSWKTEKERRDKDEEWKAGGGGGVKERRAATDWHAKIL